MVSIFSFFLSMLSLSFGVSFFKGHGLFYSPEEEEEPMIDDHLSLYLLSSFVHSVPYSFILQAYA